MAPDASQMLPIGLVWLHMNTMAPIEFHCYLFPGSLACPKAPKSYVGSYICFLNWCWRLDGFPLLFFFPMYVSLLLTMLIILLHKSSLIPFLVGPLLCNFCPWNLTSPTYLPSSLLMVMLGFSSFSFFPGDQNIETFQASLLFPLRLRISLIHPHRQKVPPSWCKISKP